MAREHGYRRDIDGLRGIAVLAVLFFHANVAPFRGGYVGVDIFFVISGYLITGIIIKEVERENFSIVRFYERRIRRIFPALFVTMAMVLVLGSVLLPPEKLKDLGKSTIGVTLFISNIQFWRAAGYFDAPALQKPLLHTWSLAVEEQFYIFFPLMLVAIRRVLGGRFALCIVVVMVLSLAGSAWAITGHPSATFYLAHTRAWELLMGAIVACGALPRSLDSRLRDVIGAACVIYAGSMGTTHVGRLLSGRPLVFVGLISYSLYLLHWPLLVFARSFAIRELTVLQTVMLLLVTFGVSIASWRFVEAPFRSKQTLSQRQIFSGAAAAISLALFAGLYIRHADGFPGRFKGIEVPEFAQKNWDGCERSPGSGTELCTLGAKSAAASFLVWGDSHAGALAPAVDRSASRHSVSGYLALRLGCAPLSGIERKDPGWSCADFNRATLAYVEQHPQLRTVVLAARWAIFAEGTRYKAEEGVPVRLRDAEGPGDRDADNATLFEAGLRRTVQRLVAAGRTVVLLEGIPEVGYDVSSAFAIAARTGRNVENIVAPTYDEYVARNRKVRAVFDSLKGLEGVQIVATADRLCSAATCRVVESGHPLYSDDDHLSAYGSLFVSPTLDRVFGGQASPFTTSMLHGTN